ncbi:alpha/beta hydrolase [Marinobacterium aestuariivivens]|uniref:Alpha/beta hydrolase n=1 Tax=Marinobacterium aestuariivivens TaxID=1698799 RepID=A0ABW2AA27_9GAMM
MNDLSPKDPFSESEYQYVSGQNRASFPELFESFEQANAKALESNKWDIDIIYGRHSRQSFDICYSSETAKALVVYFHAGYWQSRDKTQFRFLASNLAKVGYHVALVNYPLCPEVSIGEIRESALKALSAVCEAFKEFSDLPLIVAGHSAGGHLAVECALANFGSGVETLKEVDAVLSISGVFDLEPLLETSLNENLKLDRMSAQNYSPTRRVRKGLPPAVFLVGGGETEQFYQQSKCMADLWSSSNNSSKLFVAEQKDHFSVLEVFSNSEGKLLGEIERYLLV